MTNIIHTDKSAITHIRVNDDKTFEMEFVRPDTAFGVNTATGEVSEMIK